MVRFEPPVDEASAQARIRDALRDAVARARAAGRAWIAGGIEPLVDLPDLAEVFAAAGQRRERRFFSARPAERHALLGLGCTLDVAGERIADLPGACNAALAPLAEAHVPAVLVGGFAFDEAKDPAWAPFGRARFSLPEITLRLEGDRAALIWATRVAAGDDPDALTRRVLARHAALLAKSEPDRQRPAKLIAPPSDALRERYAAAARAVIDAIRRGEAQKVVLADAERIEVRGVLPIAAVLRGLRDAHPGCLTFAHGIGERTFLGATPERLVSVSGDVVRAAAVAGTSTGEGDLRESRKDQDEHAFVVHAIEEALAPLCHALDVPAQPSLLGAGRAQHLVTDVRGRLRADTHLLAVAERLHPTPAVGGTPREAALALIRAHERQARGWYAGGIGHLDAAGRGELHVALRCGLLLPGEARLYAGAGLVRDSEPEAEAAETRLKLGALRDALERACAT